MHSIFSSLVRKRKFLFSFPLSLKNRISFFILPPVFLVLSFFVVIHFYQPALATLEALLAGPSVFIADISSSQPAQSVTQNARVDTTSAGLSVKVAPGELLPISIKLLNFGGGKKVDVTITYGIFNEKGVQIYTTTETVAVETTANFIKTIQIPFGTPPGKYIAKASIIYQGQLVPATTQFPFTVERKFLGLFQNDFILYGGITLLASVIISLFALAFAKRRRLTRTTPFDYSDIPHDERVFFELLSDTIMEMRQRVGDIALQIARKIDGLVIDEKTGRVLKITGKPSKIIAELVVGYEKALGKKVSFSLRQEKANL